MESVYGYRYIFSDKYHKAISSKHFNISANNEELPGERVREQFVLNYVVELNLINFCECLLLV